MSTEIILFEIIPPIYKHRETKLRKFFSEGMETGKDKVVCFVCGEWPTTKVHAAQLQKAA